MTWFAISARPHERALQTASDFLQEQSSQGWMRRMLLGESAAAEFKKLQSKVVEELGLVQAETLLDVAGGVQALRSQMEGRTFSADEGAETRRAVAAKVEELGGWDAVQRDPAALAAVAALMEGDGRVLSAEMERGFDDVKASLGRVEVGLKELIGRARLIISDYILYARFSIPL